MITEWRLRNFKSVFHETAIRLAPLTLLTGTNSSGKSTLIQSIGLGYAGTIRDSLRQGTGGRGREISVAISYGYSSGGDQTRLSLPV